MNTWNQKSLSRPCETTMLYNRKDLEDIILIFKEKANAKYKPEKWISELTATLKNANSLFKSTENNIKYEKGYIFAFIYQNGSHKNEKFLHEMKKVRKCLRRWDEVGLIELFNNTLEMIPKGYVYIQSIRMPTPQFMYYLLQRLVGSFHLLLQCILYCHKAAIYLRAKTISKHCIQNSMLGYAIVSRIRVLILDLVSSICKASDSLHPYIMAMVESNNNDFEKLPEDLSATLKKFVNKYSGKSTPKRWNSCIEKELNGNSVLELLTTEDDPSTNTEESAKIDKHEKCGNFGKSDQFNLGMGSLEEDIGEVISHSKFNKLRKLSGKVIETGASKKKFKCNKKKYERSKYAEESQVSETINKYMITFESQTPFNKDDVQSVKKRKKEYSQKEQKRRKVHKSNLSSNPSKMPEAKVNFQKNNKNKISRKRNKK